MLIQRVLRTAAATLAHTFVIDEAGTDSTTTVTATVTDANGTVVQTVNAATGTGQGRYTFALTPQAALARLSVAWSGTIAGAAVTETDQVEIVGGRFFTLTEGRNSDSSLKDANRYP